jgi:hypothetical protein
VALVRTDVSEEPGASFIRVTRIDELETAVPPKHRFLQEPHGITSQKTPFFIVTAVKTSNLTSKGLLHILTKPVKRLLYALVLEARGSVVVKALLQT